MSASPNQSSHGLAIQDLYPDYVWDREESHQTEDSDSDRKLTRIEGNFDLQEEPDPLTPPQEEEEELFQSNLVSFYLQDVATASNRY